LLFLKVAIFSILFLNSSKTSRLGGLNMAKPMYIQKVVTVLTYTCIHICIHLRT
jgi:hypothetical protein